MWLDSYDEIFSDFDPSPYLHRIVSDDFISEAKKIYYDKNNYIKEFNLYVPENLRSMEDEEVIKKRLYAFFQEELQGNNMEFKQIRKKGILFALFGVTTFSNNYIRVFCKNILGNMTIYIYRSGTGRMVPDMDGA